MTWQVDDNGNELLGMRVRIKWSVESGFVQAGSLGTVMRNVTDLYYNYPSDILGENHKRMAVESDIHNSGVTYDWYDIGEIEVTPEQELAAEFAEEYQPFVDGIAGY